MLDFDAKPRYLVELTISDAKSSVPNPPDLPDLSELQFLTDLNAPTRILTDLRYLPRSLTRLRVRGLPAEAEPAKGKEEARRSKAVQSAGFPPNLTALGLVRPSPSEERGVPPSAVAGREFCDLPRLHLPETLVSLELSGCLNQKIGRGVLPRDLRSLDLAHSQVAHLPPLPARLSLLNLEGTQVRQLESPLPSSLTTLNLSGTPYTDLAALPRGLKQLVLRWSHLRKLAGLPPNLRVLDLEGSKDLVDLGTLPLSLEVLNVAGTQIKTIRGLPWKLRILDISGTSIENLASLPPFLKELIVGKGQLIRMTSLPKGIELESLKFRDGKGNQ